MREKDTDKSRLAKDLSHALFICHLRDDLAELLDDAEIQDNEHTSSHIRDLIEASYLKATVLLACSIVDSKDIQGASGREKK
jgi:hypothetical protein